MGNRLTAIVHAATRTPMRRSQLVSLVCQWARWEGIRVSERTALQSITRPPSKRHRHHCLDCGIDTVAIHHYPYYLHNELWLAIVPSGNGMLCIDCAEVRLGRALTRQDFDWTSFGLDANDM